MYITELSIREFRCIASADIDFLHPDSPRAEKILALHVALASTQHADQATAAAASILVDRLTADDSPHANCAQCHRDLAERDPSRANAIVETAIEFLAGVSGG